MHTYRWLLKTLRVVNLIVILAMTFGSPLSTISLALAAPANAPLADKPEVTETPAATEVPTEPPVVTEVPTEPPVVTATTTITPTAELTPTPVETAVVTDTATVEPTETPTPPPVKQLATSTAITNPKTIITTAMPPAPGPESDLPPTIQSDMPDYNPGGMVTSQGRTGRATSR